MDTTKQATFVDSVRKTGFRSTNTASQLLTTCSGLQTVAAVRIFSAEDGSTVATIGVDGRSAS